MRFRPSLLCWAGMTLALASLALLAPAPTGAADTTVPSYFYQSLASSPDPLHLLGASGSAVLVRQMSPAGELLTLYPLNGAAPQQIARAGGPFPAGGTYPANTQFLAGTVDGNGNVVFRAFSPVDDKTWQVASVVYSGATQHSTALQPFTAVPAAVKDPLAQPFDSNNRTSVRTTAASDGSFTAVRALDDQTGATEIIVQTGDKIAGSETVQAVGAPRIDLAGNIFVPVGSNQGHAYLERFVPAAGTATWQLAGAATFPAGFAIRQVALSQRYSDQMIVLGTSPGAPFWAVNWMQSSNPPAVPVDIADGVSSRLGTALINEVVVRLMDRDRSGKSVRYHLLPYLGSTHSVMDLTVSFDPQLAGPTITDAQPAFNAGQQTPLGPATPTGDSPVAIGTQSTAFSVLGADGSVRVVAATPFPAPGQEVAVRLQGMVVYTGAGGASYPFSATGAGVQRWGDYSALPDGSSELCFDEVLVDMSFAEQDGTVWQLRSAGPSTGYLDIPDIHWVPIKGRLALRLNVTVGTKLFPGATLPMNFDYNPMSGQFIGSPAGSDQFARDIFDPGDQAELKGVEISDVDGVADQTTTNQGTTSTTFDWRDTQGNVIGTATLDYTGDHNGNGTTTLTLRDQQGNVTGKSVLVETDDHNGKKTAKTTRYDAQGHDTGGSLVVQTDDGKGHRITETTGYDGQGHETGKTVVDEVDLGGGKTRRTTILYDGQGHETGRTVETVDTPVPCPAGQTALPLTTLAQQAIEIGLTGACQALAGTRDALSQADPQKLQAATAQGLMAASVALGQSAGQLSQLKAQGLPVADDWLAAYTTMGTALSTAAQATAAGAYEVARPAFQMFATELANAFPKTPEATHPEVGTAFAAARDTAGTSANMAGLLADLKGGSKVPGQLAAVAAQLDQGPQALQQVAGQFLALDDTSLRHGLGLDDPVTVAALQNIGTLAVSPAVIGWSKAVRADPSGWASAVLPFAYTESVAEVGDSLCGGGQTVLAISFGIISCPDECTTGAPTKRDCGVTDFGLSTGGAETTNPDDLKNLGKAVDLLGLVPGDKLSPLGEAAQKDVLKAIKGLVSTLQNTRPTVWIKVGWKECESEHCFPSLFLTRNALMPHTTDWTKVGLPDSFTGKRVDQWDGRDLQAIRDAAAKKAQALCQ